MNNILIFVMFMNVFGFGSKTERKPKCLSISAPTIHIQKNNNLYISGQYF